MSEFDTGIPDITVIIRKNEDTDSIKVDIPDISVAVTSGDSYSVNIVPNTTTISKTGSFSSYADIAGFAISASFFSGSVENTISSSYTTTVSGGTESYIPLWTTENTLGKSLLYQTGSSIIFDGTSFLVTGSVSSSIIQSNEFKLTAGSVTITYTGSINTGIFGVTEDVYPYISTIEYSGTTIEYVAQRPGATRIGIIMATWSGSSVVFTDVSTADIGDTRDISFGFVKSGDDFKLRVNSNGSGSGTWTVQSLFKLFPNLNP